jgi:hypothetical protein
MPAGARIVYNGDQVGEKFKIDNDQNSKDVLTALRQTVDQTAQLVIDKGKEDMAGAGNFTSSRWQDGLHADVTQGGRNIKISVYHDVEYFGVFEFGATIYGKPLLWIPLTGLGAEGIMARDYPGGLFRVDRTGVSGAGFKGQKRSVKGQFTGGFLAPLLLSFDGVPRYFGKESVTIPQKFHIRDICQEVADEMPDLYEQTFDEVKSST